MSLLTPALVRAPRATAIRGISMSACKTRPRRLDTLPTVLPAGVIPRSYDRMIDVSTKTLRGGGKLSEGLTRMLSRTTRFPDGLYSEPCSCFSESVVPCGARVSTSGQIGANQVSRPITPSRSIPKSRSSFRQDHAPYVTRPLSVRHPPVLFACRPMLRASHLTVQRGAARVSVRHPGLHHASHAANTGRASLSRRVLRWTLVGAGLGLGVTATGLGVALSRESELRATADANGTRPPTPLRELLRTYVVYGICSFPTIVDSSSTILSTLLSIPIVDKITEAVVRVTFFDQVRQSLSSSRSLMTKFSASSSAPIRQTAAFPFYTNSDERTRDVCSHTPWKWTKMRAAPPSSSSMRRGWRRTSRECKRCLSLSMLLPTLRTVWARPLL
jgi:hypothetical protein